MGGMASSVAQPSGQQGNSGIFGGAAGAPPTDTARGLPMVGGLGGALMGGVAPAFQGEPQAGLKAGAGPVNHIAPMPTMANDLVAPAAPTQQLPVGIGPPADLQPAQQISPAMQPTPQPVSPFVQQMMRPPVQQFMPMQQPMMMRQMPPQFGGLQALMANMMGRYNAPRMPVMMPQYGRQGLNNPLAYRPNMAQANQALSRVRPSVYKSDLDTARARIAELEAQLRPADTGNYGGG
jgi:hypothetical protein